MIAAAEELRKASCGCVTNRCPWLRLCGHRMRAVLRNAGDLRAANRCRDLGRRRPGNIHCRRMCLAGASHGAGIGIARWKIGPWMLLWYAVTFGVATVTWSQPQTGGVTGEIRRATSDVSHIAAEAGNALPHTARISSSALLVRALSIRSACGHPAGSGLKRRDAGLMPDAEEAEAQFGPPVE